MARKTYTRRRTRKRAAKTRYRRKKTYRRKNKTSTGKLWKYVKKATKSEVKRCDILYPSNSTYDNTSPTGDYSVIFSRESHYLYRLVIANNGSPELNTYTTGPPWIYEGHSRFWLPYQLTFQVARGSKSFERVGDKIYAKYINFKIQYYTRHALDYPHYAALYFVEIKRSVSGTYKPADVIQAIWDGVADFCRTGHETEIYSTSLTDAQYTKYRNLMAQSFAAKRKKFLKGIRIRKLHSTHQNLTELGIPTFEDQGAPAFNIDGSPTGNTWTATVTSDVDITKRSKLVPITAYTSYPQTKDISIFKSKLVPINREWKYNIVGTDTEGSTQQLDEYKYYLIALCSDYRLGTSAHDMRYHVSGELVYTDK